MALRASQTLVLTLLRLLPRNALSRLAGALASLELPAALQALEIRLFARATGIDVSEARDPIAAYPSLQAFFTRALRPGARPVDPEPGAFVSPCDGTWGQAGRVASGTLLQVKGIEYRLADLLGDPRAAERYEGGCYATLYLSPRDYHRFHVPARVRMVRVDHLPGSLWPVNAIGLEGVDALFARNERLCAYFELGAQGLREAGDGVPPLCIVAVGATMVGSVRLRDDALATNRPGATRVRREFQDGGLVYEKGEEWGHFAFGSTLVVVAAADALTLVPAAPGTPLRLGARIGTLAAGRASA